MPVPDKKSSAGRESRARRPVSRADLKSFLARAADLAGPLWADLGLELVQARALLSEGRPVLRFLIDRTEPGSAGGSSVTLDDCAAASRALDDALETWDGDQPDGYVLEISSPGLDRPLLKREDFARFQGRLVRLKLRRAGGGGNVYRGRLTASARAGGLALETEAGLIDFDWDEVVSGRLSPETADHYNTK